MKKQNLIPLIKYVDRRYQKCNWCWGLESFLTGTNILLEYALRFKKYTDPKGNIKPEYSPSILNIDEFIKIYNEYFND